MKSFLIQPIASNEGIVSFAISGRELLNPVVITCTEKKLDQISRLFELFISSPDCEKEIISLSRIRGIKIDFSKVSLESQGCWLEEEKKIKVRNNLPIEKKLQTFIFELCNANNADLASEKTSVLIFLLQMNTLLIWKWQNINHLKNQFYYTSIYCPKIPEY